MWKESSDDSPNPLAAGAQSGSKSRRKRTSFSKENVELLLSTFETNPYPGITLRESLSQKTGIPESRIQVWFQNKRARTLKYRGNRQALWKRDPLSPKRTVGMLRYAPYPVSETLVQRAQPGISTFQGQLNANNQYVQPVFHAQVNNERNDSYFYNHSSLYPAHGTQAMALAGQTGHLKPSYGFEESQILGTNASFPLRNSGIHHFQGNLGMTTHLPCSSSMWNPAVPGIRSYRSCTQEAFPVTCQAEQNAFYRQDGSPFDAPATPDSGYWDVSQGGSPPAPQCFAYSSTTEQDLGFLESQIQPPETEPSLLTLVEILDELQPEWWGSTAHLKSNVE